MHIPKTAGTTIEEYLEIQPTKEYLYSASVPVLQHLPPPALKEILDKEIVNSYFKFTIVRNPYERIVSDFIWFEHLWHSSVKSLQSTDLSDELRRLIISTRGFYDAYFPGFLSSFENFILFRKKVVKENAFHRERFLEHCIPQILFLEDGSFYDRICRFETLETDVNEVFRNIGVKRKFKFRNPASSNYHQWYTPKLRAIVDRIEEPSKLGYRFDNTSLGEARPVAGSKPHGKNKNKNKNMQ